VRSLVRFSPSRDDSYLFCNRVLVTNALHVFSVWCQIELFDRDPEITNENSQTLALEEGASTEQVSMAFNQSRHSR